MSDENKTAAESDEEAKQRALAMMRSMAQAAQLNQVRAEVMALAGMIAGGVVGRADMRLEPNLIAAISTDIALSIRAHAASIQRDEQSGAYTFASPVFEAPTIEFKIEEPTAGEGEGVS